MEMFFLVIQIMNSVAVIPEKYPKEQCEEAGKVMGTPYRCVPAPKPNAMTSECDNRGVCRAVPLWTYTPAGNSK